MEGDPDFWDYYRHFESPGLGHCWTGTGLYPADIFKKLMEWVEEGKAPDVLEIDVSDVFSERKRILCPHPQVAKYKGGDAFSMKSYVCE